MNLRVLEVTPFYPDGAVSTLRKGYWNNCTKRKANCNYLSLFIFRVQRYKYFLKHRLSDFLKSFYKFALAS